MAKKMVSFHSITREIKKTRKALKELRPHVTPVGKKRIDLDLKSLSKVEKSVIIMCTAQDFLHHLQWFEVVPKKKK
jgi:hypothetical protein